MFVHWIGLFLVVLLCSCSPQKPEFVKIAGRTMGTTYHITYRPFTKGASSAEEVKTKIDQILERVNNLMSTYRPKSQISQFNSNISTDPFVIDSEFFSVVTLAQKISDLSDGAFDITVGPAVNRWGFGPLKRQGVPSESELKKIKSIIGYKKLKLINKTHSLQKKVANLYIDLSAIAKGYGVDAVSNYLNSIQSQDYLVEIGGEIRVKGKHGKNLWRLGVVRPTDFGGGVERVITLSNTSMATSGDYRNFYKLKGKRYSHTIDPRTAQPVTHNLASVTVITDKGCAYADALATTLSVLGEKKGLAFAQHKKIAALFIYRSGDRFVERMSQEMVPYIGR
jgi:thiamine biosynthesis lipoprotein